MNEAPDTRADVGDIAQRHLDRRPPVGFRARRWDARIASRLAAVLRRQAHHDRESCGRCRLVQVAGRLAADRRLHRGIDVARRQAVARGAVAVDVDATVGWPSELKTARSVMPGTVCITSLILPAVFSSAPDRCRTA
jgi:hypothetical protein